MQQLRRAWPVDSSLSQLQAGGLRALLGHGPPSRPLCGSTATLMTHEPVGSRVPYVKASVLGFHPQKLPFLISPACQRELVMWPRGCLLLTPQPPELIQRTGPWAVGGQSLGSALQESGVCHPPQLSPPLPLHLGPGHNPPSLLQ